MIFKDLVVKMVEEHGVEKIVDRVVELYPDEHENREGHAEVLDKLVSMEPVSITEECYQGMEIEITHVVDDWGDSESPDEYEDVHGRNGKTRAELHPDIDYFKDDHTEECWGLDFTPWNEWLGMPIRQSTIESYSELDIMAYCLWEISWMGFEEETIQEKKADLDERAESIKNGTAKLIPWEVIRKELDEKIANSKKEKEE